MKLPKFIKSEVKAPAGGSSLPGYNLVLEPLKIVNMADPKELAKHIIELDSIQSAYLEKIQKMICPACDKPVDLDGFRDLKSLGKFEDTGLCQTCQDKKGN